ncbi:MAG: hypothetical protein IJ217_03585 [Clostridia bacterium]|nr:hypothetical protein [Clostridia bacterium]
MKKRYILIPLLTCIALLISCGVDDLNPEELENNITNLEAKTQDETNIEEQDEQEAYSFDYTDIHFSHSPSDLIKVSITYPQFKDTKLADLNAKIEEFAKANFMNVINDPENSIDTLELTLEEKYNVGLTSESLISIGSEGELTIKGAAYPTVTNTALNIHPIDLRKFPTSDLINITDDFVTLFKETAASNEQLAVYLTSFSDEEIKTQISNSKVFFTDDETIIMFSVPHAIGDCINVTFDNDTINPYL